MELSAVGDMSINRKIVASFRKDFWKYFIDHIIIYNINSRKSVKSKLFKIIEVSGNGIEIEIIIPVPDYNKSCDTDCICREIFNDFCELRECNWRIVIGNEVYSIVDNFNYNNGNLKIWKMSDKYGMEKGHMDIFIEPEMDSEIKREIILDIKK